MWEIIIEKDRGMECLSWSKERSHMIFYAWCWHYWFTLQFAEKTEPNPAFQAAVSLLSTGPVGPSDRIGYSNVDLINRYLIRPYTHVWQILNYCVYVFLILIDCCLGSPDTTFTQMSALLHNHVLWKDNIFNCLQGNFRSANLPSCVTVLFVMGTLRNYCVVIKKFWTRNIYHIIISI